MGSKLSLNPLTNGGERETDLERNSGKVRRLNHRDVLFLHDVITFYRYRGQRWTIASNSESFHWYFTHYGSSLVSVAPSSLTSLHHVRLKTRYLGFLRWSSTCNSNSFSKSFSFLPIALRLQTGTGLVEKQEVMKSDLTAVFTHQNSTFHHPF